MYKPVLEHNFRLKLRISTVKSVFVKPEPRVLQHGALSELESFDWMENRSYTSEKLVCHFSFDNRLGQNSVLVLLVLAFPHD